MDSSTYSTTLSASDLFARKCATFSGVVFIVWDMLGSSREEYNFIFRTPTAWIKWMYVLCRFGGLFSQLANFIMLMGPLSNLPVPPSMCRRWLYIHMVQFSFNLTMVEVILVLRTFALYGKNTVVGVLLGLTILSEIVITISIGLNSIPVLNHNAACMLINSPDRAVHNVLSIFFTQTIIWGFAFWKYKFGLQERWSRSPVVSLVIREGGLVYTGICGTLLVIVPISVKVRSLDFVIMSFINCISLVSCRLIINLRQLRDPALDPTLEPEITASESVIHLTTIESASSLPYSSFSEQIASTSY